MSTEPPIWGCLFRPCAQSLPYSCCKASLTWSYILDCLAIYSNVSLYTWCVSLSYLQGLGFIHYTVSYFLQVNWLDRDGFLVGYVGIWRVDFINNSTTFWKCEHVYYGSIVDAVSLHSQCWPKMVSLVVIFESSNFICCFKMYVFKGYLCYSLFSFVDNHACRSRASVLGSELYVELHSAVELKIAKLLLVTYGTVSKEMQSELNPFLLCDPSIDN